MKTKLQTPVIHWGEDLKLRVQSQELKDTARGKPETEYSLITRQSSEEKDLMSPEQYAPSEMMA